MLILPQTVEMTWVASNTQYYKEKGYKYTKQFEKFNVNVLDLPYKSLKPVKVLCDYCSENRVNRKFTKKYANYNREREIIPKDACKSCKQQKREDVFMKKYNIRNPSYNEEVIKKITSKRRTSINKVRKDFIQRGLKLISDNYINHNQRLKFICSSHQELGEQYATYKSLVEDRLICSGCLAERKSSNTKGNKNPMWRGGTRQLNAYLRTHLTEWSKQSFIKSKGRCIVTGETDVDMLTIHHLYSFKNIVLEALDALELNYHESVGDYSEDQLELLINEVLNKHSIYPLGILISKDVHYKFHSIYGKGNNTPEQFNEFINRYYNMNSLVPQYTEQQSKYFPKNINRSTRFHGVCFVEKQKNKFVAMIKHHGNTIYIGSYETDIEGAYFFNQKAIELRGKHTTINYLNDNEIQFVEDRIRQEKYKNKKTSNFKHVSKRSDRWECAFRHKGRYYYVGLFDTELEAVKAYNIYIIDNKLDKPLINPE